MYGRCSGGVGVWDGWGECGYMERREGGSGMGRVGVERSGRGSGKIDGEGGE